MEASLIENESLDVQTDEVHIVSGISPTEVDQILYMVAESSLFDSEELMNIEDMVWGCAFQEETNAYGFIQAKLKNKIDCQTIGFLCYSEMPDWSNNYELMGIVVTPEYQRLGVGKALIDEMERQVVTLGAKTIYLETGEDESFENARLFYEANGYEMETRFCRHFIPKKGFVVYKRVISQDTNILAYQ